MDELILKLYAAVQDLRNGVPTLVRGESIDAVLSEAKVWFGQNLPEWAIAYNMRGTPCLHAQLLTRDGRRVGNARVAQLRSDNAYGIVTDAGNEMVCTHQELDELWYIGQYILNPKCPPRQQVPDHVVRETVNELRDIAERYHDNAQLRDRIEGAIRKVL